MDHVLSYPDILKKTVQAAAIAQPRLQEIYAISSNAIEMLRHI